MQSARGEVVSASRSLLDILNRTIYSCSVSLVDIFITEIIFKSKFYFWRDQLSKGLFCAWYVVDCLRATTATGL